MSRYTLAVALLFTCLIHPPAWGAEGELSLGFGPAYSHGISSATPDHGVGLLLDASYGLGEFISLRADAQWSHYPASSAATPSAGLSIATLGISGSLDVLVAVPYLHLGAGLLHPLPAGESSSAGPELSALLALGAQWRRWPGWALAAELRFHAVLSAEQGMPSFFSLALKGHWIYEP